MAGESLLLAAVQLSPGGGWRENLDRALALSGEAARAGAELVALPEYFAWYGPEETWRPFAEEHAPEVLAACRELARGLAIHLLLGSVLLPGTAPGKARNVSILLGPGGEEAARYAKIHLFDVNTPDKVYRESDALEPGTAPAAAAAAGWTLGLSICYDLRFPGLYRELRALGAEILCVPAAFTLHTGRDHWEALLRARAIENQCYVLAPALCGSPGGKACFGRSLIADPWGLLLAGGGDGEGFVLARAERRRLAAIRRAMPVLEHEAAARARRAEAAGGAAG